MSVSHPIKTKKKKKRERERKEEAHPLGRK
jgi:hypothetical protein